MKVYNAFDNEVASQTEDYANNSSLVFKLTGEENSMLFLADLSAPALGEYLLERYGAGELHAGFVQAAHHGNWGQPSSFYEALQPEVMYFDAPDWLLIEDDYTAKELAAWCDENGIKEYDFRTAPNTVTFH